MRIFFIVMYYLAISHHVFAAAPFIPPDEPSGGVTVYSFQSILSRKVLEALPDEIVYTFTTYLDPLSVVKLSHVSGKCRKLLNNDFWVRYNFSHNYQIFDEEYSYLFFFSYKREASPIKVLISNYYYQLGIEKNDKTLIKKSSILGLPKAEKFLRKERGSYISCTVSDYRNYDEYCYKCMTPGHYHWECRCP